MPSTLQRCSIAFVVGLALSMATAAVVWLSGRDGGRSDARTFHDHLVARWVADGGREASFTCHHCGTGGSLLTMSPPGDEESFPCRACGKPIPHP